MRERQRIEARILRRHRAWRRRGAELRRLLAQVEEYENRAGRWYPVTADAMRRLEALERLADDVRHGRIS